MPDSQSEYTKQITEIKEFYKSIKGGEKGGKKLLLPERNRFVLNNFGPAREVAASNNFERLCNIDRQAVPRIQPLTFIKPIFIRPGSGEEDILVKSPFYFLTVEELIMIPAGTQIGEHIFTTALAPQETATIAQKTWTERKVTVTDEKNSESETNMELSSTNATDISSVLMTTEESKTNFEWHANASGGYEGGGFKFNVEGGVGGNQEDSTGSSLTNNNKATTELIRRQTARARAEHKISFRIDTTSYSGVTDTRVIKNLNVSRTLMLNYYKIFQKFTFEKYINSIKLAVAIPIKFRPNKQEHKSFIVEYANARKNRKAMMDFLYKHVCAFIFKSHENVEYRNQIMSQIFQINEMFYFKYLDHLAAPEFLVYLPVRYGFEDKAVDLVRYTMFSDLSKTVTSEMADTMVELSKSFGKRISSFNYEDFIPTDGTYCEPTLGVCEATDQYLKKDLENLNFKHVPTDDNPTQPVES